jgi:hypothetical protein
MLQLQLPSLVKADEELVAVEAPVTAELLDLKARILVTVFQAQERNKDERAFVQSKIKPHNLPSHPSLRAPLHPPRGTGGTGSGFPRSRRCA